MTSKNKTAVVAIGGNSLIMDAKNPGVPSQWEAVRETCRHIADMIERGWDLVITHGNGPQVGFILRRNELAEYEVHPTPLDVIGADTQGSIGYMVSQALGNEFRRRGLRRPIAALVTQVLVDRSDPAFHKPTKGIGGFTTEEKARVFEQEGWSVIEDAGRGWRRVIASPMPLQIVELDAIRALISQGFVVIAVGGGGVPVIDDGQGGLTGTRAVIDKDRATSLLAQELKVDLFLISTGVAQVAVNYNTPDQRWLSRITVSEARRYLAEKQFPAGSMGPKIEAVVDFLEAHPAGQALITDPPNIARALDGQTGTWLVADGA
jgi:carbamate kinase